MRKALFIFSLILPVVINAQVGRLPYETIRQTYRGDTLETTIGDTVKHYTNADAYSFNKPLVIRDTSLIELIEKHGGSLIDSTWDEIVVRDTAFFENEVVVRDTGLIELIEAHALSTETDPVFAASVAYGITGTDTAKWNSSSGGTSYTFEEGLTETGGTVTLGGSLSDGATIGSVTITPSNGLTIDVSEANWRYFTDASAVPKGYMTEQLNYSELLTGSLTDGAPAQAEITTIVGYNATAMGSGYHRYILDSDGTGYTYLVVSDGTNWHYYTPFGGSSGGGSSAGDEGDIQISDGNGGFTNSDGILSDSYLQWNGTQFNAGSPSNGYLEANVGSYSGGYLNFYVSDGESSEISLSQNYEMFCVTGTGSYEYSFCVLPVGIVTKQLSGSLTDGAPTEAEITAIMSASPFGVMVAGLRVTIKDTDGTGLLYKVESDGTSWYYTVLTKAQ